MLYLLPALNIMHSAQAADVSIQTLLDSFTDDVVDKRTFPRAADAGNANEHSQRNFHIDILQVMLKRIEYRYRIC